jgi:hypothetical protein
VRTILAATSPNTKVAASARLRRAPGYTARRHCTFAALRGSAPTVTCSADARRVGNPERSANKCLDRCMLANLRSQPSLYLPRARPRSVRGGTFEIAAPLFERRGLVTAHSTQGCHRLPVALDSRAGGILGSRKLAGSRGEHGDETGSCRHSPPNTRVAASARLRRAPGYTAPMACGHVNEMEEVWRGLADGHLCWRRVGNPETLSAMVVGVACAH